VRICVTPAVFSSVDLAARAAAAVGREVFDEMPERCWTNGIGDPSTQPVRSYGVVAGERVVRWAVAPAGMGWSRDLSGIETVVIGEKGTDIRAFSSQRCKWSRSEPWRCLHLSFQ
jgi:hypothetical protein